MGRDRIGGECGFFCGERKDREASFSYHESQFLVTSRQASSTVVASTNLGWSLVNLL